MGKKAKFKQIRKLASQMPNLLTQKVIGEKIKGEELYKQGVEKVEGKPVLMDEMYRKKTVVDAPLNHNRKMKQLYNQYGAAGVGMYINAVNMHMTALKAKEEKNAETFTNE
jgi:hypothetical protein